MGCPADKHFQQTNGQQRSSPAEFVFHLLKWSVETLGDEAVLSAKQGLSDDSAPSVLEAYWGRWPVQDHDE